MKNCIVKASMDGRSRCVLLHPAPLVCLCLPTAQSHCTHLSFLSLSAISEFASNDHSAGSPGDEALANKILEKFHKNNMKTWTDEHYVKLQVPPTSGSNSVKFRDQNLGSLQGYLAYSGSGTVQVRNPTTHLYGTL